MVALNAAKASNVSFASSLTYRPVGMFVGGTSGIGEGTAEAFAHATKGNAHIFICGRSQSAFDRIVAGFPKTDSDATSYEFIQCDARLIENVVKAAEEVKQKTDRLNFLMFTQSIMNLNPRAETKEGIDEKMALNFYGRWKFVDELLPLLQKAKDEGQEARVLTVYHAGYGTPLDTSDIGLKNNYTSRKGAAQMTAANDLFIDEYARRYPTLSFNHIYPGAVNTPLTHNLHWSLKYVTPVLSKLPGVQTVRDSGEMMMYVLTNEKYKSGGHWLDDKAEEVNKKKLHLEEESRKALVAHYLEAVKIPKATTSSAQETAGEASQA